MSVSFPSDSSSKRFSKPSDNIEGKLKPQAEGETSHTVQKESSLQFSKINSAALPVFESRTNLDSTDQPFLASRTNADSNVARAYDPTNINSAVTQAYDQAQLNAPNAPPPSDNLQVYIPPLAKYKQAYEQLNAPNAPPPSDNIQAYIPPLSTYTSPPPPPTLNWEDKLKSLIDNKKDNILEELNKLPLEEKKALLELSLMELYDLDTIVKDCNFADCITILKAVRVTDMTYDVIQKFTEIPKDQLREVLQNTVEAVKGNVYPARSVVAKLQHFKLESLQDKVSFKATKEFKDPAFINLAKRLEGKTIVTSRLKEEGKTFFVTTDGELVTTKKEGSRETIGEGGVSIVKALYDESGNVTAVESKVQDPFFEPEKFLEIAKALPKSPYFHVPRLASYEKNGELKYGLIAPKREGDLLGMSSPPLPFKIVKDMMRDIVLGVKTIHDNNIVHFDLKEHNCLYNTEIINGELKIRPRLADWDFAKFLTPSNSITGGTIGYMHPQLKGKHYLSKEEAKLMDLYAIRIMFLNFIGPEKSIMDEGIKTADELLACVENLPEPEKDDSEYVLHFVCKIGNTKMVEYFLDKGFDVNHKDANGRTPLFTAVAEGRVSAAKLLLKHGALNIPDKDGITPFIRACKKGNIELVTLLLTEFNIDKKELNLALTHARQNDVIQILIKNGAK